MSERNRIWRRFPRDGLSNLYFVTDETETFVKIGLSTAPTMRLKELQLACPLPLEIWLNVPDIAPKWETAIHQHLALWWLHHEWFLFSPEVRTIGQLLADGAAIDAVIPEPSYRRNKMRLEDGSMVVGRENVLAQLRHEATFA